ncbi:alanine--glyoxylate aminotransferase family protein [Clostridium fermenticellae]|uniref:Alanine--glyoxylate aminotransferase family protein n=1 Tax=Clostridium fermenticellae TaxID=2068654 RepID=A0A386H0J4_9CLOT|nr:alanine--glyoxylate aminotransferase family protein [Clostridium fermenticellae]AYD39093.1 alanine--glyoxylate aminotransferase family protein [Clostridium fermenticellae]
MKVPYIMTPGPTQVRENVRLARGIECTNPDLDLRFYDFYRDTCDKIGCLLNTKNRVRILNGEGIIALESACASLTEKGDRVLVIDNGIFGEGFADFVRLYGGEVVFFKGDRTRGIDIGKLEKFLNGDSDFKYATVVHCDTPSGVLNDISKICPLLKEKGILTVVDSVSAIGGEEVKVDDWNIDIVLGASQKCISAPPGLAIVSISEDAIKAMKSRETPVASFYCNLLIWENYYDNKWFPYTQPSSDIVGFSVALDNLLADKNVFERHSKIAEGVRYVIRESGLKLYLKDSFSSTVTVINTPDNVDNKKVIEYMYNTYNILIAGAFDYLDGKVFRIGHMGENARLDKVAYALFAFQRSLKYFGVELKCDLSKKFLERF